MSDGSRPGAGERRDPAAGPGTLCDLLARTVRSRPNDPAVITDGAAVSYADLGGRAQGVARLIGDRPADNPRVALLTDGGLAHVVLYWGVLLSGGVTVELNPGLGDPELKAQLDNAEPCPQMPAGDGNRVNHFGAQLISNLAQFFAVTFA